MNRNMRILFDNIKDGLLIVAGDDCRVVYANAAALTMQNFAIGEPLAGDWLSRHINDIRGGYRQPPISFELELAPAGEDADRLRATLVPSPVGSDFIVLLKNLSDESAYDNVISNLAEMLDCHFREPMQQFFAHASAVLEQCRSEAAADPGLRDAVTALGQKGDALLEGLQQLGMLASTFKSSPMRGDERIKLPELLTGVFTACRSLLVERHIRVSVAGINDKLPLIYGSRTFLVEALAGYLRHLLRRLPRGVDLLVSAKPKGNFVLLSIANFGQTPPPGATHRSLLPLLKAGGAAKPGASLELALPLCKRVIELNGGSLRFDGDEHELNRITFELPVGAPALDEQALAMQQAQRYAEDLLALMQRQSESSQTERDKS